MNLDLHSSRSYCELSFCASKLPTLTTPSLFRGNKAYSADEVRKLLGFSNHVQHRQHEKEIASSAPSRKFLLPIAECKLQLTNILEQLQNEPWEVKTGNRAQRCTGAALSIAIGLLETTYKDAGARIMMFTCGPATEEPGAVVGIELRDPCVFILFRGLKLY
jgi:protein transport protein SEC23